MKGFREEAKGPITKFVNKNFPFGGKKRKEAIKYHLDRLIGKKDNLVIVLKENEGFLGIDKRGNLVDV